MHIQTTRIDGFDPAVMDRAVSGTELAHVQLSSGTLRGRLVSAEAGLQRLDYGHYNLPLQARGEMPGDRVTLGLILNNPENTSFNGHIIGDNALVFLREGEPLDYRVTPDSEWIAMQVTRKSLEQLGIDPSNLPQKPVDAGRLTQFQTAQHVLRRAIATLNEIDIGRSPIIAAEKLVDKVFSVVLDEFQALFDAACRKTDKALPHRAADRQLVRQAAAFIDVHLSETLQVGALCAELNTNWRTLERAFLRLLGMPPKRYIQMARLAEARRLLLQSGRTGHSIAEIAYACGINHLGRFSQTYRSTFGELPSQTLRRTKQASRR